MRTIIHNSLNCASESAKTTIPMLTIYPTRNEIRLNRFAQTAMKIKNQQGSRIIFHQDEKKLSDWYMQITSLEEGFYLREARHDLIFRNSKLTRMILKSINYTSSDLIRIPVAPFPINENGQELFSLLTSSVKK